MKRFTVIILFISCLFITSSCKLKAGDGVIDYYGEYYFELPLNHRTTYSSNVCFFETDYSMEQMQERINEAGYSATLHENGSIRTILISAEKNEFAYYFVIYDKVHYGNDNVYTLCNATSNIKIDVTERVPNIYVFLAPLHLLESTDSNVRKTTASFDDIASFFSATGNNDALIDDNNKTIVFECKGSTDFSWIEGSVIIQFIENENGKHLEFKAPH